MKPKKLDEAFNQGRYVECFFKDIETTLLIQELERKVLKEEFRHKRVKVKAKGSEPACVQCLPSVPLNGHPLKRSMKEITLKELELLEYLNKYSISPTYAQIKKDFMFASNQTVADKLFSLEKKGYIEVQHGKKQGITLKEKGVMSEVKKLCPMCGTLI